MRTHAPKPKASQKTPSKAKKIAKLQGTTGNQAQQMNREGLEESPNAARATAALGFDFSRIPLYPRAQLGQRTQWDAIRLLPDQHAAASAELLAAQSSANGRDLHRDAAGPGPASAPAIVQEVLRGPGHPIPEAARSAMEARLGYNFADVRVHTDPRAGASAEAVAAHAYTVGRHIVFAPGRFDVESGDGRRLLTHELIHAASQPAGKPAPSGELRISTPGEPAERHAASVAQGLSAPGEIPAASSALFRQGHGFVKLDDLQLNHDRVTVPPITGLSFSAKKAPANASSVKFSLGADNAAIAAKTTVDSTTGVIAVAGDQLGGSAHVRADQVEPGGGSSFITAPFNFTAIPAGISSTATTQTAPPDNYGGEFVHTFKSPAGGQAALERSHVNEQFPGATGTTLVIKGSFGPLTISVNNPNSPNSGWDLDASGAMGGPDHVNWDTTVDARPFVKNASHPAPSSPLPQELIATQNFRNLSFPDKTYGAAVASVTHRRAFEDRNHLIKAVTSANAPGLKSEVVDDYAGPTIFRRCKATPASIPVAVAATPGAAASAAKTSTISVDAEGKTASPNFSVRPPNPGCTISSSGELTPGTTPGTVTVRAGDSSNFDETTVTLTPPPATPAPNQKTPTKP
jgi:hypothetical protein